MPKLLKPVDLFLIGLLILPTLSQAEEPLTFFRIGTGPSTETLYRLGTAISAGISRPPGGSPCDEGGVCGVPGLIAVSQSKSGSMENIQLVRDRMIEAALVSADMVFWAYVGRGPFLGKGAFGDLRIIANLIPVKAHFIVRKASPYYAISDLQDADISIGLEESGESYTARIVLRAHELDLETMSLRYLRPGPASDAIANSTLDAMVIFGAEPVGVVSDLVRRTDIRILPFTDTTLQKVQNLYPFIHRADIQAGTYDQVPLTKTFKLGVQWITHKDADPALIRDITRAFWQGQTEEIFKNDNPDFIFPDIQSAVPYGWGAPLHDGAKSYYQEISLYQD